MALGFGVKFSPDDSQAANVSGFVNDITERKNAEEKIKQSQEAYKLFIGKSGLEISHFELSKPIPVTDPPASQIERIYKDAYLAETNKSTANHYDSSDPVELIGKTFGEVVFSKEIMTPVLERFIESGYHVEDVETREFDSAGNENFYLTSIVGIIEDDRLVRIWGIQRNITERKKTEKSLSSSRSPASPIPKNRTYRASRGRYRPRF